MRYIINVPEGDFMVRAGFSLVELSIVLVILGLLTGGILTGQNLIRAAELRSVVTDISKYKTAAMTFRDKYFALPGDMTNATDFWGSAGGTGADATCQNTASTGKETCNGTGDGQVNSNAVTYGERFRYWQHLANAGLIEGSYTGRDGAVTPGDGSDSNFYVRGQNSPPSRLGNAFFTVAYLGAQSSNANYYDTSGGNHYGFRGPSGSAGVVSPEEIWGIDKKIDDGFPATGNITGFKSTGAFSGGCTTPGATEEEWNVSDSSVRCTFTIWNK